MRVACAKTCVKLGFQYFVENFWRIWFKAAPLILPQKVADLIPDTKAADFLDKAFILEKFMAKLQLVLPWWLVPTHLVESSYCWSPQRSAAAVGVSVSPAIVCCYWMCDSLLKVLTTTGRKLQVVNGYIQTPLNFQYNIHQLLKTASPWKLHLKVFLQTP